MLRSYRSGAAALVAVMLSACSGGGGASRTVPYSPELGGSGSSNSAAIRGFAYDATLIGRSQLVGPAHLGGMSIDVVLPMRDAPGLRAYAAAVGDPKSGSYRRFLTPEQIADRYSATAAQSVAARTYFAGFGLAVAGWKQRMMLRVSGPQAKMEQAFHTTFGAYRSPLGETFFAPEKAPSVTTGVPVVGSANIVMRTNRFRSQLAKSTGTAAGYAPQQFAAAFDYNGAYAAGYTGSGITLGIIGTGPIQTSTGGRTGDAEAYRALFHVAGSSAITVVPTDATDPIANGNSGFATPPPVTAPCTASGVPNAPASEYPTPSCNPEDGETQLDTEQALTLARDSSIQYFLAYNPNDGCGGANGSPCAAGVGVAAQGLAEADEELQTAIDRNTADVLSLSYGGAEYGEVAPTGQGSPPFEFTSDGSGIDPTLFAMLAAEGTSVFVASGDTGAQGCQPFALTGYLDSECVQYPASDPSVTGVGGVTAPLNSAGTFVGPVAAWGVQTTGGTGGSGGGISAYFAQPNYQIGLPGVTGTTRNVPDVAMVADPGTGAALLQNADPALGGAMITPIGGTSLAAPQMASMWALVLQACKQTASCATAGGTHPYRLGNPAPLLYGFYKSTTIYPATFLPVGLGSNSLLPYCYQFAASDPANCPTPAPGATATPLPSPAPLDPGFTATPGYNTVTGLGVPFARALIKSVVGI